MSRLRDDEFRLRNTHVFAISNDVQEANDGGSNALKSLHPHDHCLLDNPHGAGASVGNWVGELKGDGMEGKDGVRVRKRCFTDERRKLKVPKVTLHTPVSVAQRKGFGNQSCSCAPSRRGRSVAHLHPAQKAAKKAGATRDDLLKQA